MRCTIKLSSSAIDHFGHFAGLKDEAGHAREQETGAGAAIERIGDRDEDNKGRCDQRVASH